MKPLPTTRRNHLRGMATVLVFIILVLVGAFVVANGRTLTLLRNEIRLLERRHQAPPPPPAATNAPTTSAVSTDPKP